jgi:hypothetical protein
MLAFLQHTHNLIPVMEWELQFSATTGLSMSQTRFALSFLGAVTAGMLIRLISYPKRELQLRNPVCCTWGAPS